MLHLCLQSPGLRRVQMLGAIVRSAVGAATTATQTITHRTHTITTACAPRIYTGHIVFLKALRLEQVQTPFYIAQRHHGAAGHTTRARGGSGLEIWKSMNQVEL